MSKCYPVLLTAVIVLLIGPLHAQLAVQRHIPITNGEVHASAISGDTLFIGGKFSKVSLPLTYGTILSASNGTPDLWADRPNFTAHDCVSDGGSGWYVSGEFNAFGNNAFSGVAHIRGDGTTRNWQPDMGMVNDPWSVTTHDNWVFFAGTNNISGADTVTGANIGWNVTTNGIVFDMAARNGVLYVGGIFTLCNGMPRSKVAAIDIATGSVTSWNVACNNDVHALHHSNDGLLVGGKFTSLSGLIRNKVGMLDRNTGLALPFDPNVTGNYVGAIDHVNDTVYIGGDFTEVGGQLRSSLAATEAATGSVHPWAPNVAGTIDGLVIYQDQVIGVGFTFAPGAGAQSFDRSTGSATVGWSAPTATDMESVALSNGQLYIAGDHVEMGRQVRTALAAVRLSTGEILPWNPVLQSVPPITVNALEVADGKLFAGGSFVNVDGSPRGRIAAFDLATGILDPWDGMANNHVHDLEVYGHCLYVGGEFSTIGGQVRQSLASFDRSGLSITGWAPNPTTPFYDFTFLDDNVYLGTQGTNVPVIDTLTGLSNTWINVTPTSQVQVSALAEQFGNIYFGGDDISDVNGVPREQLAAADATTGALTMWDSPIDPFLTTEVSAIATNAQHVYVGGVSTTIGGTSFVVDGDFLGSLLALDINTGAVPAWQTVLTTGDIFSLEATDSLLVVGGDFGEVEMQPRPGLAVYGIDQLTTFISDQEDMQNEILVAPVPYQRGDAWITLPEGIVDQVSAVYLIDQMGRTIELDNVRASDRRMNLDFDKLGLSSGHYLVRVLTKDRQFISRVIVHR